MSTTNSSLVVLLGNGDGTFQPPSTLSVTGQEFMPASAGLNGDHIPDLVVGRFFPTVSRFCWAMETVLSSRQFPSKTIRNQPSDLQMI
jgi:hypothetical protein